jgi:hypothetical protein
MPLPLELAGVEVAEAEPAVLIDATEVGLLELGLAHTRLW